MAGVPDAPSPIVFYGKGQGSIEIIIVQLYSERCWRNLKLGKCGVICYE
jgi:hypothetical protein